MVEQELTWVGLHVGDFLIDEVMGEGAFSAVYRGTTPDGNRAAFKVAKPRDLIAMQPVVRRAPSQAVCFYTGGIQGVHPDAIELLKIQFQKIRGAQDPTLPKIEKVVFESGFGYYQMDLLDGVTLRRQLASGPVALSTLIEIARAMERLRTNRAFQYHGDLKPENIMVTSSGIRILDPGHFGPLQCHEELVRNAAVTTPAYYPWMEPDDLFAFGIILWEAAARYHPLMSELDETAVNIERIGKDLMRWVRSYEQVGLYFLRSLFQLSLPRDVRPELSPACQDFLLKAIGLRITENGQLDKVPSFTSFHELADGLEAIERKEGQDEW